MYTKLREENFPHSRRLKTLKDFKHSVVIDLIGSFSCRKQLKKSSSLRLPMQNSGEHHLTRVSFKERGRASFAPNAKLTLVLAFVATVATYICAKQARKTALQNGTVVSSILL